MPNRDVRLIAAALAALVVLGTAAPAQKVFKDEKYGYCVKTVPKWVAVPVQPTERYTVVKWASPRDERRYPGRMMVHVFDRKAGEDKVGEMVNPFMRPSRSFSEWAKRNRQGLTLDAPEPLEAKGAAGGKVAGQMYETTYGEMNDPRLGPRSGYFTVIAIFTLQEREYALEIFCGVAVKKKYRRIFLRVVKSFRFIAAGKKDVAAAQATSPREAARLRARKDAERVPGWWYVESENYFIVTNTSGKRKARIHDLKRRLEAMRVLYERDFPPVKPITAVSIVRVCKDMQSYRHYGGPPGSGGYWYSAAQELVIFHRGEKNFARSVLNHEAFHQYIHYACGEINPHIWYNEGHADYYGGAEVLGNRAVIRVNKMRVDTIRGALRAGTYVPLPRFLRYTQAQYYRNAQLCYAQGWSLVYFLTRGVDKAHPWQKILPVYFKVLIETGKPKQALDTAFKGVDLTALDAAWKKFILEKKMVRP